MTDFPIPYENVCKLAGETDTVEDVLAGRAKRVNAPLPDQLRIVDAIRKHREVVVTGGNALGKSHMLARLLPSILLGRVGRRVICTSVTDASLKEIVFSAMADFWAKIGHLFPNHHKTIKTLFPDVDYNTWFLAGKVSKPGVEESFAGSHSQDEVVILADEATKLDPAFFRSWDGLRKSGHSRIILFCNGLSTATPLYEFSQRPEVHNVQWSALTHPNVVHRRQVVPGAVTYEEVEKVREEQGEDSYEWVVRIDGRWFTAGTDNIIPLDIISSATHAEDEPADPIVAVGVDIARQGANNTEAYGFTAKGYCHHLWSVQGIPGTERGKGPDIVGRMEAELNKGSVEVLAYDADGIGAEVGDFVNVPPGKTFIPYRAGDDTTEKKQYKYEKELASRSMFAIETEEPRYKYANFQSEAWWELREDLESGGAQLPNDHELHSQLSTRKYDYNGKGEILLESKKQWTKGNQEKSPDKADAVVMAHTAFREWKNNQ